jgi:branched-chain amino acid aminotransferase
MTGTAAEVTPVTMVDGRVIGTGKVGETTKKIQEKYHDVVTGKDPKYAKWLDYVG